MDLGLQGPVTIVPAASKGLGRDVDGEPACEGASFTICARTARDPQQAAVHFQETAGPSVFHQDVDVANPAAESEFFLVVEERFGRLGICVTNSGGPPSKLLVDTNPEDWRAAADLLFMSFL